MIARYFGFHLLIGSILSAGCVSTSARRPSGEVDAMIHERAGVQVSAAEMEDPIERAARDLLARPLTPESAAQMALLKNPGFRGRLAELGIAQAELAQAALIENPRVHASLRFPRGGDDRQMGREMGVSLNFLDILTVPLKKRLAASQLEQAKLRIGQTAFELTTAVKAAFYGFQASQQKLEIIRKAADSLQAAATLAERQRAAGNITQIVLDSHQAAYREAVLSLARAKTETFAARERLAALMGAQDKAWTAEPSLPDLPSDDPALEMLEPLAMAQRWDLAAARREPTVLRQALSLNRAALFGPFEIGVDSEREFDGTTGVGPEIQVGVPLFDRKQASSARLKAQIRQSQATVAGLEAQIKLDLRIAHAELGRARRAVESYKIELLPLKRRIVAETLKQYNFMIQGVFTLLQAKREELAAQSEHIDSLKEYWIHRAELERAVGGRFPPDSLEPVKPPVPGKPEEAKPSVEPQQHHHHEE